MRQWGADKVDEADRMDSDAPSKSMTSIVSILSTLSDSATRYFFCSGSGSIRKMVSPGFIRSSLSRAMTSK